MKTPAQQRLQQGLTLVELIIATALGMVIILAVTGLVVFSSTAQSAQYDASVLQDTARFALANVSRSIKQAGYVNWDIEKAALIQTDKMSSAITGLDANSENSSDTLTLRFFGSGAPDNIILNCNGFGVPAPTSQNNAEKKRGESTYYVAEDVDHEPALFCKYDDGNSRPSAQAIAKGVESFQVLYGITTDALPHRTQFLNATAITALDAGIPKSELNQKTHWKKISAIKIAMLIRGTENLRTEAAATTTTYHLFGEEYSNTRGAHDLGTRIHTAGLPLAQRNRIRQVVSTTVPLRNPLDV